MNRSQFENEVKDILAVYPERYEDRNWIVKFNDIDGEYYIRWTNGFTNYKRKEIACYLKNNIFKYH